MEFQTEQLTKSFGEKQVLKNVSLHTKSGSALGLLGRNGAGKTTTIRIIMGVFPPDGGRVLIDGAPIQRENVNIGYLPEERGLYPKKLILEQLLYLAQLHGMSRRDAKASITRWLTRFGMEEQLNKKLDTLSKGNQQKIQLAATLITDPDFVILDEPFSGLDPVNAMMLKDVVKELIEQGKVVLFSSHQMNYVEEFCDNIAILNQGEIVLSGKIREIKRSYDRSKIVVASAQRDQIAEFCRERLSALVLKTEPVGEELKIYMKSPKEKNALISALVSQQFDLDSVRVFEPSLNDIFVEYTEDAI
jgi:ABC-2 type transport system ATP-binding protein